MGKSLGQASHSPLHPDVKDLLHRIFSVSVETVTIFYISEVRGEVYLIMILPMVCFSIQHLLCKCADATNLLY